MSWLPSDREPIVVVFDLWLTNLLIIAHVSFKFPSDDFGLPPPPPCTLVYVMEVPPRSNVRTFLLSHHPPA